MGSLKEPNDITQKLHNLLTDATRNDRLVSKSNGGQGCLQDKCMGSVYRPPPDRAHGEVRPKAELESDSIAFINEYYDYNNKSGSPEHTKRLVAVKESIAKTGTYHLTTEELTFGAKTAWRNASRCIGRIQWKNLMVMDARHVRTARDMFQFAKEHLKYAGNGGNIRSCITVFPQRTDGKHDYKVWNPLLISYACYKQTDGSFIGDPLNEDFTKICMRLGWQGKGTHFDVLPLVCQANGGPPEYFQFPEELVLEIPLKHPTYKWFEELKLKWLGVPGVSSMLFDCGGIEFPAAPFNGWYMGTEVASRDLCDSNRYNLSEKVAKLMGLDTRQNVNLWKDKAVLEVNIAVLHSYKEAGVTMVDHHTASEQFMSHLDTEYKIRGGCPADWVWVVPPMSSSSTPVFHMEMLNYKLRPSYEYQPVGWSLYTWPDDQTKPNKKQKLSMKAASSAVLFAAALMRNALSKRTKCTILFATETGKSRTFAEQLAQTMGCAFNTQHSDICAMDEYKVSDLDKEQLILMVASTFGNGEPPHNGQAFFQSIKERLAQRRSLKGIHYSVFALGSSAYPHFCEFGRNLDESFEKLGAKRILGVTTGDELSGQDDAFNIWSNDIFKKSCSELTMDTSEIQAVSDGSPVQADDARWSACVFMVSAVEQTSRLGTSNIHQDLEYVHKQKVHSGILKSRKHLQAQNSKGKTCHLVIDISKSRGLTYQAGDHAIVYPQNNEQMVDAILHQMRIKSGMDTPLKIQYRPNNDAKGTNWLEYERLPHATSFRTALTHYLNITSPPNKALLRQLAQLAKSKYDKGRLEILAQNGEAYIQWRYDKYAGLLDVLKEFPSLELDPSFIWSQLPIMKPRYYSISSCQEQFPGELHLTVSVVQYERPDGSGEMMHGVCSNWLNELQIGKRVPFYVKSGPNFHMPDNPSLPIILVANGTGIAPLRGLWQQRQVAGKSKNHGRISMYFGCRHPDLDDLYQSERTRMASQGVISQSNTAYSRLGNNKVYVQDLLYNNGATVYRELVQQKGHMYICGSLAMCEGIKAMAKKIFIEYGRLSEEEADVFLTNMKYANHWHENIFGVVKRPEQLKRNIKIVPDNNTTERAALNEKMISARSKTFSQRFVVLPHINQFDPAKAGDTQNRRDNNQTSTQRSSYNSNQSYLDNLKNKRYGRNNKK